MLLLVWECVSGNPPLAWRIYFNSCMQTCVHPRALPLFPLRSLRPAHEWLRAPSAHLERVSCSEPMPAACRTHLGESTTRQNAVRDEARHEASRRYGAVTVITVKELHSKSASLAALVLFRGALEAGADRSDTGALAALVEDGVWEKP